MKKGKVFWLLKGNFYYVGRKKMGKSKYGYARKYSYFYSQFYEELP